MKTTKYDPTSLDGRALSENYNEATPGLDEVQKTKDSPPSISGFKGPCRPYRLIGAYEGAATHVGEAYRPSGACKMRNQNREKEGEFCFVCKYLIVSKVNPSKLDLIDKEYPESKERKWDFSVVDIGEVPI